MMMMTSVLLAQPVLDVDFNDGTFGGFKVVDVDGLTPVPDVVAYSDGKWKIIDNPNGEGKIAAVTSWYDPAGKADDWLISPKFAVPETGYKFTFEVSSFAESYLDGFQVWISTTDDSIESFTDLIVDVPATPSQWQDVAVSLDDYVGKSIHVAIRNNSQDKYLLGVNNITVLQLAAVDGLLSQNNYRWQVANDNNVVKILLENRGTNSINSAKFDISVGENSETVVVEGLDIATYIREEVSMNLTNISLKDEGDALVKVTLVELNGVAMDVSIEYYLTFLEKNVNRKIIAEEATGTWCGFCPRGEFFLQEMERKFGEDFIGVAVHGPSTQYDPMSISEYANTLGVDGYPTILLNREFDAPNFNLDSLAEVIRSKVVPVEIDVTSKYKAEDNKVYISGVLTSAVNARDVDISVIGIISENGVTGTTDKYNQANYFANNAQGPMNGYENLPNPVPAADMVYNEVARAVIGENFAYHPDYLFTELDKSTPKMIEMVYEVEEGINKDSLHATILVIDRVSGDVLNANDGKVDVLASVGDIAFDGLFELSPNPAVSNITITIGAEELQNAALDVMDINGKMIDRLQVGSISGESKVTYDVSHLESGMYIIKLIADNQVASQKLTVLK